MFPDCWLTNIEALCQFLCGLVSWPLEIAARQCRFEHLVLSICQSLLETGSRLLWCPICVLVLPAGHELEIRISVLKLLDE
jgi:hypothetical protein